MRETFEAPPDGPEALPPPSRRGGGVPVPRTLLERPRRGDYEHVILGAGCAGLSLCLYLLEEGVEGPIAIVDRRTGFEDDRTWCFWDVEPTPFSHLALGRWERWTVRAGDRTVAAGSERYPYLCLTGGDFYASVLETLASRGDVALLLGEEVDGYEEAGGGVVVRASGGELRAEHLFDARGLAPGSQVFEEARRSATWVPQVFFGMRVRTRREVFEPGVCTLMDFAGEAGRSPHFYYVLPFGPQEALVENVYLGEVRLPAEVHRAELRGYMRERLGVEDGEYVVDGEEAGYIPMTTYRFPRRLGERAYAVGMLGGDSRPSTGYTFLRIQRQCRALARAVAAGEGPPEVHPRRLGVLDGIFLRYLKERPEDAPAVYARMFAATGSEALVRFLTEKSTPLDEARLISALPKTPFIATVARMLLKRGP